MRRTQDELNQGRTTLEQMLQGMEKEKVSRALLFLLCSNFTCSCFVLPPGFLVQEQGMAPVFFFFLVTLYREG